MANLSDVSVENGHCIILNLLFHCELIGSSSISRISNLNEICIRTYLNSNRTRFCRIGLGACLWEGIVAADDAGESGLTDLRGRPGFRPWNPRTVVAGSAGVGDVVCGTSGICGTGDACGTRGTVSICGTAGIRGEWETRGVCFVGILGGFWS